MGKKVLTGMMSDKVTVLYIRLAAPGHISLESRVNTLFDIADCLLYLGNNELNLIERAVFEYSVRNASRSSIYL